MDPLPLTPELAGFSVTLGLIILFIYYRLKFSKTVICWFCSSKNYVKFEDRNSWICSDCEQYNGFNKDGDYNQVLPAQYDEKLNNKRWTNRSEKWTGNGATLCDQCNYHQQLKVSQLASFQPIIESNYDLEVKHFEWQLERSYKLCSSCQRMLENVLKKISESSQLSAPRRLFQKADKVVRRWKFIWLVPVFIVCLQVGLFSSPNVQSSLEFKILSVCGGIVTLCSCWFYQTTWAWVHAILWFIVGTLSFWKPEALEQHVITCQLIIAMGILVSSVIIAGRRLLYENRLVKRQIQRLNRRKQDAIRVWSVPSFRKESPEDELVSNKKEEKSAFRNKGFFSEGLLKPSLLKPSALRSDLLKPSVVRPKVKRTLDQDMRRLKLGHEGSNWSRYSTFSNTFSPTLQGEAVSRSSSQSSGIGSLSPQRTSPINWTKDNNSHFSPLPHTISTPVSWFQYQPSSSEISWNTCKSSQYREGYSSKNQSKRCLSPLYPMEEESKYQTEYQYQGYKPFYPCCYSPPHKASSETSVSYLNIIISFVPAMILAVSNSALVYLLYSKS